MIKRGWILSFLFLNSILLAQDSLKVNSWIEQSKDLMRLGQTQQSLSQSHQAVAFCKKQQYHKGLAQSYNQLGAIFESHSNYDSANFYLNASIQISEKFNFKDELAVAHNLIGLILWHQSTYKEALPHHNKSLSLFQESNNQKGIANTYTRIGNVYYDLSDFPNSLDNFLQSLKRYANLKDSIGIAEACNYLGKVYSRLNERESAKKYLFKALGINQRLKNSRGIAISYNGLGNLFMDNFDLIKALKFFIKSKEYHQIGGDKIGISIAHINIGTIYDMMYNLSDDSLKIVAANLSYRSSTPLRKSLLDSARYNFKESIQINSQVGNKFGLIYGYNGIGDIYVKENNYQEAIPQYKQAYALALEVKATSEQYETAKRISRCFEGLNLKDSAFYYLKTYIHVKEEVVGEERQRELYRKESQYEYEKQIQKQKLIRQAQLAVAAEKQKQQWFIITAVVIVLVIVIYFAIILNKRLKTTRIQNKLIEQQKSSIEQKNKEIIDSIMYAKRIQDAMLTSQTYIENELKKIKCNSFIVFKPKDIVSGDFYWFHVDGDEIFYMTADSTGHGVPGGFMSMLGINLLSEIVVERKIKDPGMVLNLLREEITRSLKTDDGYAKDGMDAVFCRLNTKAGTLDCALANNALYIVRQSVLLEFKAQKMPVGYMEQVKPFETKRIELQTNDVIYTFTDGYADQFGGEKGKKFKYSQLKNKLIEINALPLSTQQFELSKCFEEWKSNIEQVDDVCVIGLKYFA
ncbi:MAG: tetratricopeptide repeat protein [Bacteroidia bacterium]|nr:tetratricopeptide repeat protein [Bacteroidia bacterium]